MAAPPKIEILSQPGDIVRRAATEFVRAARDAVSKRAVFRVALSGGSTPKGLYSLLAADTALREQTPWSAIHFFWGDERNVPPDHPDSNFRMASETMLSRVAASPSQVHRIRGEADAAEAALEYESVLRAEFGTAATELPRFDLVLLGMGPDGHTASLFPGTKALHERSRLVTANWVGKFYTQRVTLTAPVLNNAASVMFLVTGEDKAAPLKAVLEGPFEPEQLPAQLIQPATGHLLWLVDTAAGRMLDRAAAQR
jgi:6-phosphogluconolactonase